MSQRNSTSSETLEVENIESCEDEEPPVVVPVVLRVVPHVVDVAHRTVQVRPKEVAIVVSVRPEMYEAPSVPLLIEPVYRQASILRAESHVGYIILQCFVPSIFVLETLHMTLV